MDPKRRKFIRRRALRLEQDPAHPLYLFSLTGDELLAIADISRISGNDAGKLNRASLLAERSPAGP